MPIRGHSGVQGGAEMGAYATAFPGGVAIDADSAAALSARYGFPVGDRPGLTAEEMVLAGGRGEIDVLYSSGGNFLDVLPDPEAVSAALARVPVRVHQDIVVTQPDARRRGRGRGPAAGVHAVRAARRRHRDHHRTPRRLQPRGARPACGRGPRRSGRSSATSRRGSGPTSPGRSASPTPTRSAPRSPTSSRRTRASSTSTGSATPCSGAAPASAPGVGSRRPTARRTSRGAAGGRRASGQGAFVLSTRRGKQFNSMVYAATDPLTGAVRDAVLLHEADAAPSAWRRRPGHDPVRARRDGRPCARRADPAAATSRCSSPRATCCCPRGSATPDSGVPDYTARVDIVPA